MTVLEIKNLKSGELHQIPPSGATLGREGAKADIQIRDPGVSKRHARIYEKGGVWYLVDMGSSNGTFLQGKRLTGPITLAEGNVFGMSRHKFEVVRIVGDGANGAALPPADDELYSDPDADLAPPDPGLPPGPPPLEPEPEYEYESPPPPRPPLPDLQGAGGPSGAPTAVPETAPPSLAAQAPEPRATKKGAGDVLLAVPKAIAFYLASVPLLAFNPFGTVRKSIEEQKHPELNALEIIAYALPANLFAALLLFLASLIGQLVAGTVSLGDIVPIGQLVVAVVGSVLIGFLWHPVLGWLIRILKGTSDARSRSNFFLMAQTARVLVAIPSAVAVLLALIDVPFLNVLPPLLLTGASLLALLVTVKWLKHFDVLKPVQIVVLVLGLLGALGTFYGVFTAVKASLQRVTSGSPADVAEAAQQLEALRAQLTAKLEAAAPADEIEPLQEQIRELEARVAAAAAVDPAEAGDVATGGEASAGEGDVGAGDDSDDSAPPKKDGRAEQAPAIPYSEFASKLARIERVVGNDPTVLTRDKETLELYKRYHRARHDVERRYEKLTEKDPSLRVVNERLRDADVYRRTAGIVDELHKKLTAK